MNPGKGLLHLVSLICELWFNDVAIEILYCGVCHSDLHQARNDWGGSNYPLVPGHEIVGRVIDVSPQLKRDKVGDHVAVGYMVDSCRVCGPCRKGLEQLCREGNTQTYCGFDRLTNEQSKGGYSKHIVLRVPESFEQSSVAPLLCADITNYSPLRMRGICPGSRVGVVGLSGLGHMAVKLAFALDATVTVVSRMPDKDADAKELGADALLLPTESGAMDKAASSFDLIIDTIPVRHDFEPVTSCRGKTIRVSPARHFSGRTWCRGILA